MQLNELQKQFQDYLLNNEATVISHIQPCIHLSQIQALQIYQNSYYERAIQALSQDFPVLRYSLGEDAFASLIRDYLSKFPSRDFNLRYLGKNLSEFILFCDAQFEAYADLARWEWLVCEAIFTNDESMLHSFVSRFNVVDVWKAFQAGDSLPLMLRAKNIGA